MHPTKSFESLNYGSGFNSKASAKETYLQMQVFKGENSKGSTFGYSEKSKEETIERVKVYVRVRPAFPKEIR